MKKSFYQVIYEAVSGIVYMAGVFFIGSRLGDFTESLIKGSYQYVFLLVFAISFWALYAYDKELNKKD